MTWYGRSLTLIIIYSITGLSHPSYDKQKKGKKKREKQRRTGHQKYNDTVWQFSHTHHILGYNRSLTPIILYQNKKEKQKRTRH